jgi:hypothetical protein
MNNRTWMLLLSSIPGLMAQSGGERDIAPLKNWPAPLYYQLGAASDITPGKTGDLRESAAGPRDATSPAGALVFVAMMPCRVVDTRNSPGPFGGPSIFTATVRTFPIQSSANCTIPLIAQAYSLNLTVVPNGPLGFLTVWPHGQSQPLASTLNAPQGQIVANAAIVPAGSPNGSIDVYASNTTDLVIDVNGYYAAQTGITLTQGSAAAPSLSFDTGTGIFSSGPGSVDIATAGASRLTVRPDGDVELPGSIRKTGTLFLHSLGTANTALGFGALATNSSGVNNTAEGANALANNSSGYGNSASGYQALLNNTSGAGNTAFGSQAMLNNQGAGLNTAMGVSALASNISGYGNTAVGASALSNNTGNYNVAVGEFAGNTLTTGDNNIMIGNSGVSGENGSIRIGSGQARTFIAGIRGVTAGVDAVSVVIDSTGQLGTIASSRRFKENIDDMAGASDGVLRLRPVIYQYRAPYKDGSKPLEYGLIAEEVAQVYPGLVAKGADGAIETVQYQKLVPMLLNEVQKQHATIESLETELKQMKETIKALTALKQ